MAALTEGPEAAALVARVALWLAAASGIAADDPEALAAALRLPAPAAPRRAPAGLAVALGLPDLVHGTG